MRASDSERERVAETLREAVAEGRLEMAEFEQRLEATYKARTHGELEPLVRDLPAPGVAVAPVGAAPVRTGSQKRWADRIGKPATSSGAFAMWGGFGRRGNWTVGRKFTAFAMWGGGEIDLREANFEDREVVIRCITIMGGIQVTVPPELNVEVRGIGFMGGFGERSKDEGIPSPDSPRVRITGFALMGGVGVEHKRSKAEKQRLRDAELARQRELDGERGNGRGSGRGRLEKGPSD
ncbi:DUF1707 domain-containing protein [Streptomyces sp. NBC_00825]|uniref:DUF1707 SHOCT-like domain-containing protein n=1 Tax=unclassified Streptomyces TaxID=2593676 RepID=UPI002256FA94|nr:MULTISPECIES: DUF1707 domain-containing protein [unclassified Streptomyces]WTB54562.1 DUF1707 domain-containing protein [Streptomyces sp. NBC_00826]WTH92550.1 DUF1707 domain-containing protein [Streptomyces sp. NBC_00825]WTI01281.1 DUF1707 domain-containing protein [Streptomyces sp. NBC_00822]MCX4866867.1 DUF1707 domain-containing protein [Streptomyces sp. NBC_00906]MCX4898105.1 DUF1707 domain-containing protein [Streptomyces sp. NBC_00892]